VGYEVLVPAPLLSSSQVNDGVELRTYLKVSEQAMELFGFVNARQRTLFMLLTSVSGVGPKTALNVLSGADISDIQQAIALGEISFLTQVPGIGAKTAERLMVELRDKIGTTLLYAETSAGTVGKQSSVQEVLDALEAMGYSKQEAVQMIKQVDSAGELSTEELLKKVLQKND